MSTDQRMRPRKQHWDFKTFVCTGREWQRGHMRFTKRKANVTCNICHGLLKLQGKL